MVDVVIRECKPVVVKGTRKVCQIKKETVMVDVQVTECKPVVMKGTRKVCELVPVKEMREEKYCEMVPVTTTVKVAVSPAAPTQCAPAPRKKFKFCCW
jgi:hypothetical protein